MELIFGTTNPAKLAQIQSALHPLGITITGLPEPIDVEESGQTALENARLKATAYATVTNQRVMATDNALYLDGLPNSQQPGLHVRRIPSPRVFRVPSSPKRVPGHPLASLQVVDSSGRFLSELSGPEEEVFWHQAIGEPLADFIKHLL